MGTTQKSLLFQQSKKYPLFFCRVSKTHFLSYFFVQIENQKSLISSTFIKILLNVDKKMTRKTFLKKKLLPRKLNLIFY